MNFWPGNCRAVPQFTTLGCGLALALAGYSLKGIAQESPAESASVAEPADYSKGFALLSQMGLPDSSKATYGSFRGGSSRFGSSSEQEPWESIAGQFNLKGNAWRLPEAEGKEQVIADNLRLVTLNSPGKGKPPEDEEVLDAAPPDQFVVLKNSDLIADAKLLLQGLNSKNGVSPGRCGQILLFSAHLASHGMAKEANRIVGRLFAMAQDPAIVLGSAVNSIADSKYDEAMDRLMASKSASADWLAFEKELQKLVAQFGADWKMAPGVKRVAQEAKKRSSKPPSIPGLSAEDRKLADEMAEAMWSDRRGNDFGIWVIKNEPTGVPALDRIRERGLGAIPLLVALLKDDYPTRTDHRALYGMGGDDLFESSSENDSLEDAQKKAYIQMRRPASRGEIAAFMLNQALPSGNSENGLPRTFPPEQLPEEALKFYKENKGKSPAQLALLYLKNGNRYQTQFVASYVLQEKSEANLAAVEAFLLEDPVEHFDPSILRELVKAREKTGAAFLEKYRKAIESGKGADSPGYYPGREKQVLEEISEIQESNSGKTAAQIAGEVLGGKRPWKAARRAFAEALPREVPEKRIELALDLALSQKEIMDKMEVLGMITAARAESFSPTGAPSSFAPTEASSPGLDPKRFADKWRMLLADHSQLNPQMAEAMGIETLGGSAAVLIDIVYGKGNLMGQFRGSPFAPLGDKVEGIWRARAEARLAGKAEADIPKLPSASEVSAERKQELDSKLANAKPDELPSLLVSLSDSEILALADETSFKANLLPVAHKVIKIQLDGFDAEAAKKTEKWKSKPLDNELIETVRALATEAVRSGKRVDGSIRREPAGKGVCIELVAREKSQGQRTMVPPGVIALMLSCGQTRAQQFSMLSSDVEPPDSDYSAKLKSFLEGELGVVGLAKIEIQGVPEGSPGEPADTRQELESIE